VAITDNRSVATARGALPLSELGHTLTHEHLFVVDAEHVENYLDEAAVEAIIAAAAERLNEASAAGVGSVLDLTVHGVGRMIGWIERLSALTEVNLLVSTGVFVTAELPRIYSLRGPGTLMGGLDPMIEVFVRDIEVGIGSTGIRAAALKCVTDRPGITPAVERCMRAVAAAHRQTGVPIFTHTDAPTRRGLDQQRLLREEGVDLSRVVVGHSGDSDDLGYLETLLHAGSFVGLDRFGYAGPLSLGQRCDVVVELVRRGWRDRILLSHDAALHHAWMDPEVVGQLAPGSSFTYLFEVVFPELRDRGLTDEDLDAMMRENPQAVWAG
jgi:phosphotriesterase-related protein